MLPKLGVGITYNSCLDPLLDSNPDLVDVLEIEPQTYWFHTRNYTDYYRIDEKVMSRIRSYKHHKIVHGVGTPVGGSSPPDPKQIPLFLKTVKELNSPWASEHLSFNTARDNDREFKTAFSLPPRQTLEGVKTAIRSIQSLANQLSVPFAVENGVNYLKCREDELTDGEFISEVIENADCGLVLDLHNAWTNEVNGRQKVCDFLKQISVERIWEIHVAGGSEEEGFYLDSHSGEVSDTLFQLLHDLIPRLSFLRAIIFETSPSYLDIVDTDLLVDQLRKLRHLWRSRSSVSTPNISPRHNIFKPLNSAEYASKFSPREWEDVLGALVIGHNVQGDLARQLSSDPGLKLLKKIVFSNRASMLVKSLKLSVRLLMLTLGVKQVRVIINDYFKKYTPDMFTTTEAEKFAGFLLQNKQINVPYLADVLKLEVAIISGIVYGGTQKTKFQYDPRPVLNALSERKLPNSPQSGSFEVTVSSDGVHVSHGPRVS